MRTHAILAIGMVGIGFGMGLLAARSTPSDRPIAGEASSTNAGDRRAELSSEASLRARLESIHKRAAAQDARIAELTQSLDEARRALEDASSLDAGASEPDSPEALRASTVRYYFDPKQWDFEKAVAALRSATGRMERDAAVVHENDLARFVGAVWHAKQENMREHGISLSGDDSEAIRKIMLEHTQRYRRYMLEEFRPRIEAAETRKQIDAVRLDQASQFATYTAQMQHAIMRHLGDRPGGRDLYDELAPYL